MTGFTYACEIDGQPYSLEQLALVRYQRDIQVLHDLKRAGADIVHDGRSLSHDDIKFLRAEEACDLSVATRQSYDPDGIRALFRTQLQASEKMWRDALAASEGLPLQPCTADIVIIGLTYDAFIECMASQAPFLEQYPRLHPDHYYIKTDGKRLQGIETFGMYGGPSEVQLAPVEELSVPIERDETYPFAFMGVATLLDGTDANVPAFHQLKPIENGLQIKAGCCFPAAMPKEMVQGHKLHLALEFLGFARVVAAGGQ